MIEEKDGFVDFPSLRDLYAPGVFREIEEAFGDLAGFPVLLCDGSLRPIFTGSRVPAFCETVRNSNPQSCSECGNAALEGSSEQPMVRQCPAGPLFVVVPVDRGGIRYGALLLGPVQSPAAGPEEAERFATKAGLPPGVLGDLFADLPRAEKRQLEGTARLLAGFARALGDTLMGALNTRWEQHLLRVRYNTLEEELREKNEFIQSIFRGIPAIVISVDLEGKYTSWPPHNEKYLGYTAEETVGKMNGAQLLANQEDALEWANALYTKGVFDGDAVIVKKDGTNAPNRFSVTRQFDASGNHVGYIGVGVDISEQKEMEGRLRLSEERMRILIETLPDIFYQTDPAGIITFANESAARILGYESVDELIGKDLANDLYVDPSERTVFLDRLRKEGGVVKDFRVRLWRGDGSVLWVSAHSRFRRDEDGNVIGVEGVARDVTDRVEAENRFVAQMEELEKAYDQLKQAQTRMIRSEKMASLGTLMAGIAHEINNPVNFVHGNLAVVEKRLRELGEGAGGDGEGSLPADVIADLQEAIEDAKRGAARVKEIVNTMRTFSRAGSRRRRERVNLNAALEEALLLVEPGFRGRVDVALRIDTGLAVDGDRALLGQVWINLLSNAFQAVEGEGRVEVSADRDGGEAVVRIRDTGVGIPAAIQEEIFEPFYSVKQDGVGLGLSLSLDIVRGYGGEISVASEPGKGATFVVHLPAAEGEDPPPETAERGEARGVEDSARNA
ncbi:MAG: PAS domain S-box protein [Planctomycetota bacterium]|jgi:PAS domain S-box-containing protein